MFGLEILDVVIGLTFVYLLLALFATALNEYIAAVLNLRGKELAKGLGHLLDDVDETDALQRARNGVGDRLTSTADSLTEQLYNHRLIRPFATRQGWMTRVWWWLRNHRWNPLRRWLGSVGEDPRLPSYIPARTFALALLDLLGVDGRDASLDNLIGAGSTPAQAVAAAEAALAVARRAHAAGANDATEKALTDARQALARVRLAPVLAILKQESSLDLTEHLATLNGLSTAGNRLAADLQLQVAGVLADAQTQLQKLHDGVEVWFNNAMDRVSGAYKRTAQGWLVVLGLLIAACMNADTLDMWRRLEADDELRSAMVRRAEATLAGFDTLPTDPPATTSAAPGASPDTVPASAPPADTGTTRAPGGDSVTRPAQAADSPVVRVTSAAGPGTPGARDTARSDSAKLAAVKQARESYRLARARLDSMEMKLGWTTEQAVEARLLRKNAEGDSARVPWTQPIRKLERAFTPTGYHADLFPFDTGPSWVKLIGLLLTALAVSLGAPFWFDLLNKVISIRTAGRSPEETPKSPEGGPKRIAERAPK